MDLSFCYWTGFWKIQRVIKHTNEHLKTGFNGFLCNKTKQMYQFHKFIFSWNSACFGQFLCPLSGVYSLYTQQWYMSYRFVESFGEGPGWNSWNSIPVLLVSCLQICMTYTIAECTAKKLLMMDRGTVRIM